MFYLQFVLNYFIEKGAESFTQPTAICVSKGVNCRNFRKKFEGQVTISVKL